LELLVSTGGRLSCLLFGVGGTLHLVMLSLLALDPCAIT
jgi:hypothetical protein